MIEKKLINEKIKNFLTFGLFLTMIISFYMPIVKSDSISTVSVEPISQVVLPNKNFIIHIYCNLTTPIKAYEFKLSFDPSLIQANNVIEGNIFKDYTTFFNPGVIDNDDGTIIDVYGLIMGMGNVSLSGNLVSISFTSKSNIGVSNITLYDVGITNETDYLPVTSVSGEVIVNTNSDHILIEDESPVNKSVNVDISTLSLNVLVINPSGNLFNFEIISSPDIGSCYGYNQSDGVKFCGISGLSYQTNYTWFVNCTDIITLNSSKNYYWFTTENYIPPGDDNPGDGFVIPNNNTINQSNNPPLKPSRPVGSINIEKNIFYEYSSSTYDIDNDTIRYRFDWGDGTLSDWSEYVSSNETISMNHSWSSESNYDIRVICQDEKGDNSSWSDILSVVVSESNNTGSEPDDDSNYTTGSDVSDNPSSSSESNSDQIGGLNILFYPIIIVSISIVSIIYVLRFKFEKLIINHHNNKIKNLENEIKIRKS